MNICFLCNHSKWGSLSNNGGSRTIALAAYWLREFGHTVDIVAPHDRLTWVKHPKVIDHIPKKTDAVIAVTISDIAEMHEKTPKGAKLYYWARALELWQKPEKHIQTALKQGQTNIANSSWLQRYIKACTGACHLVWQGVDFELWRDFGDKYRSEGTTIGALYNPFHKTKRWDLFEYLAINFHKQYKFKGFGTKNAPGSENIQFNPNIRCGSEDQVKFYNSCNMWFSPTQLDSFHNVAAEASLCGCLLVCSTEERGGMEDFATNDTAMLYSNSKEMINCIENPDYSKIPKMKELMHDKIKSRRENMKKLESILVG